MIVKGVTLVCCGEQFGCSLKYRQFCSVQLYKRKLAEKHERQQIEVENALKLELLAAINRRGSSLLSPVGLSPVVSGLPYSPPGASVTSLAYYLRNCCRVEEHDRTKQWKGLYIEIVSYSGEHIVNFCACALEEEIRVEFSPSGSRRGSIPRCSLATLNACSRFS